MPRVRDVAQLVERTVRDRKAAGSSPVIPTIRRCAPHGEPFLVYSLTKYSRFELVLNGVKDPVIPTIRRCAPHGEPYLSRSSFWLLLISEVAHYCSIMRFSRL